MEIAVYWPRHQWNPRERKTGVNLYLRGSHSMLWERLSAPISKYLYLLAFKCPQADKRRKYSVFSFWWQTRNRYGYVFLLFPRQWLTARGSQRCVLGFPYLIHRCWKIRQHQYSNTVSTKTFQFISYPGSDLLQKLGKTFYSSVLVA